MQSACALLYCHLWLLPIYNTFPHYVINGTIFGEEKTLLNLKYVFWLPQPILSDTFLILRRIQWDTIINLIWSSCKVLVILVRFQWKFSFLNRFSEKKTSAKICHENSSGGSRVVSCGRTDRQSYMAKVTVTFRNFTNAPKNRPV